MANPEHVSKLNEGVDSWNLTQAALQVYADFRGADLNGKDLSGADLRQAKFENAILRNAKLGSGTRLWKADFTGADLRKADLSGADLHGVNFSGADLFEASLREADLEGADLSTVKGGLRTEQLAGADLTAATLPNDLKTLYDKLENVKGISESARKLFLAVLAACLYCWLTIATTNDVNLITNRNSSPLPIIQTPIPIVGFYFVAPMLVLCIYFYFQFYLQKLWEELGSLPAIFTDGRPLHTKADPWLLNDLVRAHLPKLNVNRPFLSYFQLWISVLLAWWVVPITMFLFWGRYLRRHEQIGTTFHVGLLVFSVVSAVCLYRLAVATLRGTGRRPFTWNKTKASRTGYRMATLAAATAVLFGIVSLGAIRGVRSGKPILGIGMPEIERSWEDRVGGTTTWIPRSMALIGYPPFANLAGLEVSQKKPDWSPENNQRQDSVIGAQLRGVDLRYASATNSFFTGSDLRDADLRGALLTGSELRSAYLSHANLSEAILGGAELSGTDLGGANLSHANLSFAVLRDADLGSGVRLASNPEVSWGDGADLTYATLWCANLVGANLSHANLSGANLKRANLTYSNLRETRNLELKQLKTADHWDMAFFDDLTREALGLPADHNQKLTEQRKNESELEQKQNAVQPPATPCH
jgi:uncharacterized protein YjbI with pentapeptide repeats